MARAVLVPFAISRALVGGALLLSRHLIDQLHVLPVPIQSRQGLLAWDAAFYADIARNGYDSVPREGLRFFPVVSLLARALALVPGIDTNLALLLIANLSALALGFVLYRLAWFERRDERFAQRAVWLVYLAPPAYVLVMGYAEATLMLAAAVTLLALRQRRWWVAALAGVVAGATRPIGLLLVVPALVEALRDRRALTGRDVAARVVAVAAPAAGLFAYLSWAADRSDDFLYPLRVQQDSVRRGGWRFPVTNLIDTAQRFADHNELSGGLHLASAFVALVLLVAMVRRLPASYVCFAAAALLLGLTAGNLDSFERYTLSTLPFVLAAADLTEGESSERAVIVLAAAALVVASMLAFTGILVP